MHARNRPTLKYNHEPWAIHNSQFLRRLSQSQFNKAVYLPIRSRFDRTAKWQNLSLRKIDTFHLYSAFVSNGETCVRFHLAASKPIITERHHYTTPHSVSRGSSPSARCSCGWTEMDSLLFFLLLQYICSVLATPTRWHKPRPAWWSHTRLNFYRKQISNYISKTTTKRIVVVVWVLSLSIYICLYLPLLLLCIYSALMTFQPKRTVLFAEFHINFEWKRFGCTACL